MTSPSIDLTITGMTCTGCTRAVAKALARVPGVVDVAVDLDTGSARVTGGADRPALLAAIERAGYDAR